MVERTRIQSGQIWVPALPLVIAGPLVCLGDWLSLLAGLSVPIGSTRGLNRDISNPKVFHLSNKYGVG